jgi:hypothetical protein
LRLRTINFEDLKIKTKKLKYQAIALLFFTVLAIPLIPTDVLAIGEIEINDCDELQLIGNDEGYPLDSDYILSGDIDCAATATWNEDSENPGTYFGFEPIDFEGDGFSGTFDGNNYAISNLYINRAANTGVGLFAHTQSSASITDLDLEDVDITGNGDVGALIGYNEGGTVSNVYASGVVVGFSDDIGGLIGDNEEGTIENSDSDVGVDGGVDGNRVGGLVGRNSIGSIVKNSHADGDVEGEDNVGGLQGAGGGLLIDVYATGNVSAIDDAGGGLAGRNGGTIIDAYATGDVSSNDDAGGLLGFQDSGVIVNSYAEGAVTGTGNGAGGLIGRNAGGSITAFSYATGAVTGNSRVGGLVGANGGDIENSYATGAVTGDNNVGGFAGRCGGDIDTSYSVGAVTGNTDTGGFLGYSDSCDVEDSYWDTETSGQASSAEGTGKTTIEMKTQATFDDAGWDFTNIWEIGDGTYPLLYQNDLFNDGSGTENDPYQINDCQELQNIRFFEDGYFEITADIDCSATSGWDNFNETGYFIGYGDNSTSEFTINEVPNIRNDEDFIVYLNGVEQDPSSYTVDIDGMEAVVTFDTPPVDEEITVDFSYYEGFKPISYDTSDFEGSIDGGGFTVSNLYINRPDDGYVGLVSELDEDGSISNIILEDVEIYGEYRTGALVGENDGLVEGASSSGSVTMVDSDDIVGGLVGANREDATISQSYSTATVSGDSRVGGLAGANGGLIKDSYARGNVSGDDNVGGLAGRCGGEIVNSYSTGSVSGDEDTGGLLGYDDSCDVEDSYWDIETSGQVESDGDEEGKTTAELKSLETYPFESSDAYDLQQVGGNAEYRYLKWIISDTKDTSDETQASEFSLILEGQPVDWTDSINVENPDGDNNLDWGEGPNSLVDGDFDNNLDGWFGNKWLDYAFSENENQSTVIFDAGEGETLTFDAYTWATADDEENRDPSSWTLYGSSNGSSWTLLDEREGETVTVDRNTFVNGRVIGWDYDDIWGLNAEDNDGYPFLRWQGFTHDGADDDDDGIEDAVEDAAPNNGDANNDGTPDSEQANVSSLVNSVTGSYSVLQVSEECSINRVEVVSETGVSDVADSGFDYPSGLMDFSIDCGTEGFTANIVQYHYGVTGDFVVRKYNPENGGYFTVTSAVLTNQTIAGNQVKVASYQVTDGGTLDIDELVNGIIEDPAGLGASVVGSPDTGLGGHR